MPESRLDAAGPRTPAPSVPSHTVTVIVASDSTHPLFVAAQLEALWALLQSAADER